MQSLEQPGVASQAAQVLAPSASRIGTGVSRLLLGCTVGQSIAGEVRRPGVVILPIVKLQAVVDLPGDPDRGDDDFRLQWRDKLSVCAELVRSSAAGYAEVEDRRIAGCLLQ